MIDWQAIVHGIDAELGGRTVVAAVLAGLLCSLAFTQALKKLGPGFGNLSDAALRWFIRASAFAFGFLPTFLLWPQRGAPAWAFGFAIGVLAPAIYTVAARIAVHYFPWLDGKLSARPEPNPPPSNDFHQKEDSP
jgi:hypothetical protein